MGIRQDRAVTLLRTLRHGPPVGATEAEYSAWLEHEILPRVSVLVPELHQLLEEELTRAYKQSKERKSQ